MSDEELDAVADLALELGSRESSRPTRRCDAMACATSAAKVAKLAWPEGGGVSGAPLKPRSLEVLVRLRARVGDRVVLISVGGIESADDVWDRVLAGATLVQVYTGFVYGGPSWPRAVNLELARRTWDAGRRSIQELVGSGDTAPAGDQ